MDTIEHVNDQLKKVCWSVTEENTTWHLWNDEIDLFLGEFPTGTSAKAFLEFYRLLQVEHVRGKELGASELASKLRSLLGAATHFENDILSN